MKKDIKDFIISGIRERAKELNINEESFESEYYVITKANTYIKNKKINLTPVSFGYKGNNLIEGKLEKLSEVFPHVALENLEDKVLYVETLKDLSVIHYLKLSKPKAVITNTEIKRPIYIEEFPLFFVPSFINQDDISIQLKIKKIDKTFVNYFFDIGLGAYFTYINLPFDSFFTNAENINFYSSFKTFLYLLEKLINIKHPKGYRIRVLISDMLYKEYEGIYQHLKKIDTDRVLSVINIQNCGLGNEKLIIKNRRNLIDSYHYKKLKKIFEKQEISFQEEKLKEYSNIDRIKLPVIWFSSQPNEFLYSLKKEFLNEKLILNFTNRLYFVINNLYKGY
ncbi:hypothetical protein [Persephonella sp.]|uniref:hypothetical protein n=1 Tax=Persephonella sp. TaxID=2060922 RepID=UPI0025F858E0|nr:hypothetical protein [Persephonella sp.]